METLEGMHAPKPLSKEEIEECFREYKKGNQEAREKIISHNIRLVYYIVFKQFSNIKEKDDLVQIGCFALIKAVDSYEIEKGILFPTYATRCIYNEILMLLKKNKKNITNVSLEDAITESDDGELRLENILKDINVHFEEDCEKKELFKKINEIVDSLSERDRMIVELTFGFKNNKVYTQYEISKITGISQPYVSRIIRKNVSKIAEILNKKGYIELHDAQIKELGLRSIYDHFKKHSKEKIDEAIELLSDEEKELIDEKFYFLQGKQKSELISKIRALLKIKSIKYNSAPVINSPKEDTKPLEEPKANKTSKSSVRAKTKSASSESMKQGKEILTKEEYIGMLEVLKNSGFDEVLKSLPSKDAIIVCLSLGYADNKYFSKEAISEILEIPKEEVVGIIKNALLEYKRRINMAIDIATETEKVKKFEKGNELYKEKLN